MLASFPKGPTITRLTAAPPHATSRVRACGAACYPGPGHYPRRNRTKKYKPVRTAALAGAVGPPLFAAVLAALTALQYDFMLDIGWRPIQDPAGAWPSGLALGPHGWAMDAGFAVSGILLTVFALGLHRAMPPGSKAGPALLSLSGAAMALLAFETDPIRRTGPRSWHGLVHDAAFVVFALALLLSLLALWRRTRGDPGWRRYARLTLATAIVCAACLLLPGVAYYLFLAAALIWIEATALTLRSKLAANPATRGGNRDGRTETFRT
jgi:hypothetical protein